MPMNPTIKKMFSAPSHTTGFDIALLLVRLQTKRLGGFASGPAGTAQDHAA